MRSERDLNDEFAFHLEKKTEAYIAQGLSPEAARRAATRDLDGIELRKEECRDVRRANWISDFGRDLRYAFRTLRRSPGFTVVVVLSLALGIGANTAIFSVVDRLMLRMLPVRDPAALVRVQGVAYSEFLRSSIPFDDFPVTVYESFRDRNSSFTQLFAYTDLDRPEITISGQSEGFGEAQLVSGNFFQALGVGAILGRTIDSSAATPTAVISYGYWKRRFAQDRGIVGKKLAVNNVALEIVGVTPPGFFGVTPDAAPDLWLPMDLRPALTGQPANRDNDLVEIMARLKPGATRQQAEAALNVLYAAAPVEIQYVKGNSKAAQMQVLPSGNGDSSLRETYRRPLLILMAVVGLVLSTACVNVAGLLLARAAARRTEIATRLAIGASRARIVRQLLTEGLLLAVTGGLGGLLFAVWGNRVLLGFLPESPAPLSMEFDARLLGFNIVITLITALAFGLIPAMRATRIEIKMQSSLRLHQILVTSQVALSLFLLTTAGIFLTSLSKLKTIDLGFRPEKLVQVSLDTRGAGYRGPAVATLYRDLLAKIAAIPGVRAVSGIRNGLMQNGSTATSVTVPGYVAPPGEDRPFDSADVGPGFFAATGLPLLSGRDFTAADDTTSPRVAVVNETAARRYFAQQDPIGKLVSTGPDKSWQIVGVSRDAKIVTLRRNVGPMIYFPALQNRIDRVAAIEIRTAGDPSSVMTAVRGEVGAINKRLLLSIKTMDQQVDDTLRREWMIAKLSGFLGGVALLLASIGLYGLMAYSVLRRTREIGIRMAVGAERHDVLWMVLRETMKLVAAGIVIGVPLTLGGARLASHWIEGLLFQINATDPVTITAAALILLAVAILAGYLPARRASRLDPMVALRWE